MWHIQMDSIFLPSPSMNAFNQYFCFIDFMISFTDFMLFLSSCMGWTGDNWKKIIYG